MLDAGRHAEELLAFLEVAPGSPLGEIGAGGGYTTELVARAVGDAGRVFAQNNRFVLEKFAAKPWSDRLQRRAMRNVVRVDRELDDPFPPEARDLDAVYIVLFYHDTVWMGADRDRMNRAVFSALRPGWLLLHRRSRGAPGQRQPPTPRRCIGSMKHSSSPRSSAPASSCTRWATSCATLPTSATGTRRRSAAGERRGSSDRFALQFVKPARNISAAPGG